MKIDRTVKLTVEDFSEKLEKYNIDKSKIIPNSDGTFDYDGDLDFYSMGLKSLDEITVRFRNVNGDFECSYNRLISLQGAPFTVGGSFYCSSNQLTNLEGAPLRVGGDFGCSSNKLTSLQYAPSYVGGEFYCSFNNLISLQYAPSTVGGDYFSCHTNNLLSKECSSVLVVNCKFDSNRNPFEITDEVIETVKRMTLEQQILELNFFGKHDKEAYGMLLKVLDGLGVEVKNRKEMFDRVKDNKDLNTFF
jgi:hypothetical protein